MDINVLETSRSPLPSLRRIWFVMFPPLCFFTLGVLQNIGKSKNPEMLDSTVAHRCQGRPEASGMA